MAMLALGTAIGGAGVAGLAGTAVATGVATVVPITTVVGVTMVRGISRDIQQGGTTRNTAEAAVGAVCAVGGGLAGAVEGATRGTLIYPGPGTVVGAGIGATCGAVAGDYTGRQMASRIFDEFGYELRVYRCSRCGRQFQCRIYTSQSREYCPNCDDDNCMSAPLC